MLMNNFIEWAKSPRGLIVLTIAAMIALYLIVKRAESATAAAETTSPSGDANNQSLTQPGNGTFNGPHNPSGDGSQDGQQPVTVNDTSSNGSFPKSATVRASSGSSYDKQYGGVYYFATPATGAFGGQSIATLPFGSAISLIGSTQGTAYSSSGGSTLWYQLANGGWINSHDVTGV